MNAFAIVILNWNGKELLEKFLPNVVLFSKRASIYVIDNASSDASVSFVKENYPQITIIPLSENYGYAKGYNLGLQHVKEPYWCLLNSDVEVTENWLEPIQKLFDENTSIGIIQPKILQYHQKNSFEYAGAAGGFIDRYGFPFCRGRVFNTLEEDHGQYNGVSPIFWASGACLFMKSSVFNQLKGFDSVFFAHQEEIDLCWRAFNEGILVYYHSDSVVYHVGAATLSAGSPYKTFLNFRNSLLMLYKNLPPRNKFGVIFKRLCWDGLAGIHFMFQLKPLHCFAIVKSHFSFYSHLFSYQNKVVQNPKESYFYTRSVVVSYFWKRKKTFKELPQA